MAEKNKMDLVITGLGLVTIGLGILFLGAFFYFNLTGTEGETTLVDWIAGPVFGAAIVGSGILLCRRKSWGRYLFSLCLAFIILACFAILDFFSTPLVLDSTAKPPKVSFLERVVNLAVNFPDNAPVYFGVMLVLGVCFYLLYFVHSARFRQAFKSAKDPLRSTDLSSGQRYS